MATVYVDFSVGSSGTGGTWAQAYKTLQEGLTNAGAGGIVFVKTDATPTKDTAASHRSLTSTGLEANPTLVYGCKTGTTNEPPVDSDLTIRGTDALPEFEVTGAGNDITLSGVAYVHGLKILGPDRIQGSGDIEWVFKKCEISWAGLFFFSGDGMVFRGIDCDFQTVAGSTFLPRLGAKILLEGGLVSGTAMNVMVDTTPAGDFEWVAGDLSLLSSKTGIDLGGASNTSFILRNCELPATFTLATGSANDQYSFAEAIACSSDSALGSSASVPNHDFENLKGSFTVDQTHVRTGGADDGGDGGFAYAITPNANATLEPYHGVKSPMMLAWIEGDGTAQTVTVYIANDSASTDYVEGEVTGRLFTPSSAGTAQHDVNDDDDFTEIVPASPAAITDDTGSTWGSGANNHQKLVFTLGASVAPDFMGAMYVQISVNERAASPKTCYLDPLPVVT